jgi:hypothetical protein
MLSSAKRIAQHVMREVEQRRVQLPGSRASSAGAPTSVTLRQPCACTRFLRQLRMSGDCSTRPVRRRRDLALDQSEAQAVPQPTSSTRWPALSSSKATASTRSGSKGASSASLARRALAVLLQCRGPAARLAPGRRTAWQGPVRA